MSLFTEMDRKAGFRGWIGWLLVTAGVAALSCQQSAPVQNLNLGDTPRHGSSITDVVIDSPGVPFLLDDRGHVWAFQKPLSFEGLMRLPNLRNIKQIAPYIALDKDGRVFTWSLDKTTEMTGPDDVNAAYTMPAMVKGLSSITRVAYESNRFVVVKEDKTIIEWVAIPAKVGFGTAGYGNFRTIHEREGIRAIGLSTSGTVALFKDGVVLGWGLSQTGQTRKDAAEQRISFPVPSSVLSVYLNNFHTAILTESGPVILWGGCDLDGHDFNRQNTGPFGVVTGVEGPVADVVTVAMSGNDNVWPDVFLKRDGSVWAAFAPLPPDTHYNFCSRGGVKPWRLTGMTAAATAIATNGRVILALGADHTLWVAGELGNTLSKINIRMEAEELG